MSYPYLTISSNTDSLNTASYYSDADLSTFNISQSTDVFFGNSSQDVIEFSVFDISSNLINWNILNKTDTYSVLNSSYKDVDQNTLSYNYKQYNSSYIINYNRQILLNTVEDLTNIGIKNGNYVISYNFLRNVAGNSKYKLVIKTISSDRKEIQLIPTFNLDSTNEENLLINLGYQSFCNKTILMNDIIESVIKGLNEFDLINSYAQLSIQNPDVVNSMKTIFGLTRDSEIVKFLNNIYQGYSSKFTQADGSIVLKKYDGIIKYITNWLYTYYRSTLDLNYTKSQFKYIVDTSVKIQLKLLNYNYATLDENNSVNTFIDSMFYDNFISPMLDMIYEEYNTKYYSYLKNILNFGNNNVSTILAHSYTTDSSNNTILVVKLFDHLPENIGLRDTCWVSNIAIVPLIQKVVLSYPIEKKRYKISGPNFKININQDYKSKSLGILNTNDLNVLNTPINSGFNSELKYLNVDYTNFKNFIIFSSAQLRVKLFYNKLNQINILNASRASIQSNSNGTTLYVSASYSYDTNSINSQLTDIYNSFDGFETYLYNNQQLMVDGTYTDYLNSAIAYDDSNRDSLTNNTPEYINIDDNNSDYLIFLSMAGHFFDNLYIYIQNFPITNQSNNTTSGSLVNTISNLMLENFGWHPIGLTNNIDISGSSSITNTYKLQTIWSRILDTLPIIYKTKGTEESIRLLSNIYGIPKNLLNIREFGGNNISDDDESSYTFDDVYYLTRYSGSNEYVSLPCSSSVNSVEFKFKLSNSKKYKWNDSINLLYNSSDFYVYVTKGQQQSIGQLTFKYHDILIQSDTLPFFNGNIYNVLIKKTKVYDTSYSGSATYFPNIYQLEVNSVSDDRIIFESNTSKLLDYSYAGYFASSSNLYVGNHPYSTNNFYGNLDKINIWNSELSDEAFVDHSKNFNAYNDYDVTNTYKNLFFRYSYDHAVNLASSSVVTTYNQNLFYSGSVNYTGSVYNFPNNSTTIVSCSNVAVSVYPYQFDKIEIFQNISYSNLGPNKFKNNRINQVPQTALARLKTHEKSTSTIQVNNDSNLIAAYISPYASKDRDIINFLGNHDIMNDIGDPKNLYRSDYRNLNTLRRSYNSNNLAEPVLYQEFITLSKNYLDSSFFNSIKQLIPARSKLITGVLIEPSLIERNKYQNKPINSALSYDLDVVFSRTEPQFKKFKYDVSADTNLYTASLSVNLPKNGNFSITKPINYLAQKTEYISDRDYIQRNCVFPIYNGTYTTFENGEFNINFIYKSTIISSIFVKDTQLLTDIQLNREMTQYYYTSDGIFTANGYKYSQDGSFRYNTGFTFADRDNTGYPLGHLSTKRNNIKNFNCKQFVSYYTTATTLFKKSSQNSSTTVDDKGILNNKPPIEVTSVNKKLSELQLTQ